MRFDPARQGESLQRGRTAAVLLKLWSAPYLLLILAVLFWSGNFIVGRAVAESVPPVALAFWRWTAGLAIVLALGWRHLAADWPKLRVSWPVLLALSALGIACFNTFVYVGLHTTTALNAVLLQSAMPVVIIVMTFALFRERPGIAPAVGVGISMAGVATIASAGDWSVLPTLTINSGDLWVLAAVLAYALYSVLLRKRPAVHPLSLLAVTFALGAMMLLPFLVYEHVAIEQLEPSAAALLSIAYVAVFPGVLSYLFFNRGVELAGANAAGHFIHLIPIFGSGLAILLLGETIAGFHLVGGALIAAGLVLATVGRV